jgi:hypothetical protein
MVLSKIPSMRRPGESRGLVTSTAVDATSRPHLDGEICNTTHQHVIPYNEAMKDEQL